ncbi:hypothetical protein J4460_02305 [Candidatus Woesearchaeota archaeon]|nr:hypothetical protein [Candidatus Woesearchaeota archaeon]HIH38866.1 hypothetical protein [Candidatus Woesearchaeota archaeon]HIH49118.1 hypothetical protein [Candidatus Woesearchaeota archaeon]HIJ03772.1 hypothetical protein [Candidatus Woesearchaeota archaeon]
MIRYFRHRKFLLQLNLLLEESPWLHDCDFLAEKVAEIAAGQDLPVRRLAILPVPSDKDLGHLRYPRQYRHEVVEVDGKIVDLYFPRLLALPEYIKAAYHPDEGVRLVVVERNAALGETTLDFF